MKKEKTREDTFGKRSEEEGQTDAPINLIHWEKITAESQESRESSLPEAKMISNAPKKENKEPSETTLTEVSVFEWTSTAIQENHLIEARVKNENLNKIVKFL